MKEGVRTIGIDDGPFSRAKKGGNVVIVGAVYRGGTWFDGLLTSKVRKDGWNATDTIISMIQKSKFHAQLHYIMLDGIAFGGFNIVDIQRLFQKTGLKVMVVVRKKPDLDSVYQALQKISQPEKRWRILKAAGPLYPVRKVWLQLAGMDLKEAAELLNLTCTRALIPEPLRVAHLIAGAIINGQSGRRA